MLGWCFTYQSTVLQSSWDYFQSFWFEPVLSSRWSVLLQGILQWLVSQTSNSLIPSLKLYQLSHCAPLVDLLCFGKVCPFFLIIFHLFWMAKTHLFGFSRCCMGNASYDSWLPFANSLERRFSQQNIYLTLYSIITPFDAFEISFIWKYYGKWSICIQNLNFSMLSKNRKWCYDLKIAYEVKG